MQSKCQLRNGKKVSRQRNWKEEEYRKRKRKFGNGKEKKTEAGKKRRRPETERKRGGRQSASGRKKVRQGRRERRKKQMKSESPGTLCRSPRCCRGCSPLFRCSSLPPSPIAIANQKSKQASLLCSTCACSRSRCAALCSGVPRRGVTSTSRAICGPFLVLQERI